MNSDIAIKVEGISKTFKIPHEKITSLRGAAVSVFKKKTYEEFKALDNVSFEIKKGEFFGIIGQNGSGKSTLLKILAGIYKADKGRLRVNGKISPFLELGIGFNPELSGRDNIYLNATVLGLSKKEIDEKFDSIVKFSELERFIDQKLKNYSSGMQVRLAFSVSIHANRDILLMDEVLAVGDNAFQDKCLDIFRNYKKQGRTVILVTHSMATVREYCDRAMLLDKGKIMNMGDVDDVCDEYYLRTAKKEEVEYLKGRKKANPVEDEVKKINSNESKKTIAVLGDVICKNNNDMEASVFRTGEDLNIVVKLSSIEKGVLENIGLDVGIVGNNKDNHLVGCSTRDNDKFILRGDGSAHLQIKNLPLLKGKYFINVACFNKKNNSIITAEKKISSFVVHSTSKQMKGLYSAINVIYDWKNSEKN